MKWRNFAQALMAQNLSKQDVCEQVYTQFSSCFKGEKSGKTTIMKFLNSISKEASTPKTFDDEIVEQRSKLEEQAQKKHDKTLAKKMAIADFVIEGCTSALQERPYPEIGFNLPESKGNKDEQIMVLELSDVQAGTLITRESTGGLNEFNWEILCQYFDNLFIGIQEVTSALQKSTTITTLHIHMLGDIVEGSQIFPGQEQHICKDLFHQAMGSVQLIEDFLVKCLSLYQKIHITAVCGNHGRVGKKGENPHWVNWDRIVYEFIKREMVKYPQITWKMDDSWWQIDEIFGYKFYLTHGDDIRGWAGIPYYGVDRSAQRETELLRLSNEWYDYFMIGHLHTPSIIPGVASTKFINGCFPGGTIFSMKNMGIASRPQQWLLVVHPKWGITYNCPIYLNR